jgi:hypothetical protein
VGCLARHIAHKPRDQPARRNDLPAIEHNNPLNAAIHVMLDQQDRNVSLFKLPKDFEQGSVFLSTLIRRPVPAGPLYEGLSINRSKDARTRGSANAVARYGICCTA